MLWKKGNFNGDLAPKNKTFVTSSLIWLILFFSLAWSMCMFYVALTSEAFLTGWPAFEKTISYTVYALSAYFMADFIYGVLLRWANRQYFSFMLLYGIVFAVFILTGIASFALFAEQVVVFWFEDFLSWRFVPLLLGMALFGRFFLCLYKDL